MQCSAVQVMRWYNFHDRMHFRVRAHRINAHFIVQITRETSAPNHPINYGYPFAVRRINVSIKYLRLSGSVRLCESVRYSGCSALQPTQHNTTLQRAQRAHLRVLANYNTIKVCAKTAAKITHIVSECAYGRVVNFYNNWIIYTFLRCAPFNWRNTRRQLKLNDK